MVIDTSVIAKWFTKEKDSGKAIDLRDNIIKGTVDAAVPDLIYYELGNLLTRQNKLKRDDVIEALTSLEEVGLQIFAPGYELFETASVIARKYGVTFYDASFVALAQNIKTEFITADIKLASKTRELGFVRILADYKTGN